LQAHTDAPPDVVNPLRAFEQAKDKITLALEDALINAQIQYKKFVNDRAAMQVVSEAIFTATSRCATPVEPVRQKKNSYDEGHAFVPNDLDTISSTPVEFENQISGAGQSLASASDLPASAHGGGATVLSPHSTERKPISARKKKRQPRPITAESLASSTSLESKLSAETYGEYSDGEYSSGTGSYYSDDDSGAESDYSPRPKTSSSNSPGSRPQTSPEKIEAQEYVRSNKDKVKELGEASVRFDAAVKQAKANMQSCAETPTPAEIVTLQDCLKTIDLADKSFSECLVDHERRAPLSIIGPLKVFYEKNTQIKHQLTELIRKAQAQLKKELDSS
jgi:hypothetical protein